VLHYREIDVDRDRDTLLEFHCRINYASEPMWARRIPYVHYRDKWLSTSQPASYLAHLTQTMQDERTLAEILEQNGTTVGYLWVTFTDIADYDITVAQVMDIAVAPQYQRRGLGLQMLKHIEVIARRHGAALLRSDAGIKNVASKRLHEKSGFEPYRIQYEKVLRQERILPNTVTQDAEE
jgi:ribosomal protein S18 acetylase RimI-like enzyme